MAQQENARHVHTEIEIDSRGRASLKSTGLTPGRYRVVVSENAATMTRVESYTETEILALQDAKIAAAHRAFHAGTTKTVSPDDLP